MLALLQKINALADNAWAFLLFIIAFVLALVAALIAVKFPYARDMAKELLVYGSTIITVGAALFHGKHPGDKETKE